MKEPPHVPEKPTVRTGRSRARSLTVQVQYVAIDGADGDVLHRYQIQVIVAALRWLAEHPDDKTW